MKLKYEKAIKLKMIKRISHFSDKNKEFFLSNNKSL
jgi:hypothetical protein